VGLDSEGEVWRIGAVPTINQECRVSRIYIVKRRNESNGERLVQAESKAKVADLLLRDFTIEIASAGEAFRLANDGVELEVNKAADADAL
jgi:hypothetical protein